MLKVMVIRPRTALTNTVVRRAAKERGQHRQRYNRMMRHQAGDQRVDANKTRVHRHSTASISSGHHGAQRRLMVAASAIPDRSATTRTFKTTGTVNASAPMCSDGIPYTAIRHWTRQVKARHPDRAADRDQRRRRPASRRPAGPSPFRWRVMALGTPAHGSP